MTMVAQRVSRSSTTIARRHAARTLTSVTGEGVSLTGDGVFVGSGLDVCLTGDADGSPEVSSASRFSGYTEVRLV